MADQEQPDWFRAAEELVRRLRGLLEHGDVIEAALAAKIGAGPARAELEKIDLLTRVLEVELWRTAKPSKKFVGKLTAGLALVGATILVQGANELTTDVYEAIRGTQEQAEHVVECTAALELDEGRLDEARLGELRLGEAPLGGGVHGLEPLDADHEDTDDDAGSEPVTWDGEQVTWGGEEVRQRPPSGGFPRGFSEPFYSGGGSDEAPNAEPPPDR